MAEGHYDKNGTHYVFGYMTKEGWAFVPHRFHIYTDGHITRGQFLTSMWFSIQHYTDATLNYIIIGLRGSFCYSDLAATTNKAYRDRGLDDKDWYNNIDYKNITFCDVFATDLEKVCDDNKKDEFLIEMFGLGYNTKLLMSARRCQKGVYITLPEFAIG